MSCSTSSDRTFVGVDVAKRTLEVALGSQHKPRTFGSDLKGLAQLVQHVQRVSGPHVCLEATGGYERPLVEALDQAGISYSVINPLNVRCFIKSVGKLDKTDRLDARALALFGERMQPAPSTPVSAQQSRLKDLQARREQIVEHITREKHRLEIARQRDIQRLIQSGLRAFDKELTKLDKLLKKAIAEDEVMRKNAELLTSVPGVGDTTAANLIALVPELGKLTRRKIARLAGLAPIARDSGEFRGRRFIGGGRVALRKALHMPTLVAIKHNPHLKDFYLRLVASGKPKLLAITATARKLLTILNSIIQRQTPWKNTVTA